MISVSNDYKTAAKQPAKELKAYITDGGDAVTESDDLQSLKINAGSSYCKTVMRQAEAVYFGTHNYLDSYVNLGIGVVLPDTTTEYIDYGSFKVVKVETNKASEGTTAKMFDKMYEALQLYDLVTDTDITYPATLLELLQAICDRFSWTLATTTFPNSDLSIAGELLLDQNLSFRDVLDDIAEASGSIIYFDVNDELTLRQPSDTVLDTLASDDLKRLSIESKFGEINSVVLSRMPQQDNIVQKDDDSIDDNGLTEFKIVNNLIVDSQRETAITDIYDALFGQEYYPFRCDTVGLGYFQIGDRIAVEDPSENSFEVVITDFEITIAPGFAETLQGKTPDKSTTPYQYAGVVGQAIRDTQVIVDKQNGQIVLLTSITSDAITDLAELTETVENLSIDITRSGGTNLLKNSAGIKGSIEEWQLLDENGDPIDARNTATVDKSVDTVANTESGSAFVLSDEFIQQSVPTIIGQLYTFYCRFKKNTETYLNISGLTDPVEITVDSYTDDTWQTFKYQFTPTSSNTTISIENTEVGAYANISDAVLKLGDASSWVQAPNEVYGSNFRFDKDGFLVGSETDNFRALLDSISLSVIDSQSGKIIMYISKDSGKVTNLVAQETLTIQRYEEPASSLRIIPTDTGAFIVIND